MKFFDGLVAARMMELDGERVEGQVRNAPLYHCTADALRKFCTLTSL